MILPVNFIDYCVDTKFRKYFSSELQENRNGYTRLVRKYFAG